VNLNITLIENLVVQDYLIPMLESFRRWALLVIVGGGALTLDQWAKQRVIETLDYGQSWEPIPAIASVIKITRSQNAGAAFGIFPFASDFFLFLAVLTIIMFLVFYPRLPSHAWMSRLSVALISGGALSNAIDRVLYGHVVDYVHVQLSPAISNVSNLADHSITVGVILLLIDQWRAERQEMALQQAQETESQAGEPGSSNIDLSLPTNSSTASAKSSEPNPAADPIAE
jgi:signal peptidase II